MGEPHEDGGGLGAQPRALEVGGEPFGVADESRGGPSGSRARLRAQEVEQHLGLEAGAVGGGGQVVARGAPPWPRGSRRGERPAGPRSGRPRSTRPVKGQERDGVGQRPAIINRLPPGPNDGGGPPSVAAPVIRRTLRSAARAALGVTTATRSSARSRCSSALAGSSRLSTQNSRILIWASVRSGQSR